MTCDAPRSAPWWRRLAPGTTTAGLATFTAALVVLLQPIAAPLVSWGMDGHLTPGVWEPRFGGWPCAFALVVVVPLAAPFAAVALFAMHAGRRLRAHGSAPCPCEPDPADTCCAACCGPPPRRPGRTDRAVAVTTLATVVGWLAAAPLLALPVAMAVAWVRLEIEEDAFGRRAEAAAAIGAWDYGEMSAVDGGALTWSKGPGYSSHRD